MAIANIANNTAVKTVIIVGEGADIVGVAWADLERGIAARRRDARVIKVSSRPHDFHEWARGAAVAAIHEYVSSPY
jgi:hypothetical protein